MSLQSWQTLCNPMDCRLPGFPVHGISKEEYWSELLFPFPGDLPDPGIEHASSALAGGFSTTEPPGKPKTYTVLCVNYMSMKLEEKEKWELCDDMEVLPNAMVVIIL